MSNQVEPSRSDDLQRRMGLLAGGLAAAVAMLVSTSIVGWHNPASMVFKMSFAMAMAGAIAAALIVKSKHGRVEQTAPQATVAPSRDALERAVLAVAKANGGYVTPEELILRVEGLTLRQANELLDDLAISGDCEVEADDEGHLTYRFRTGVSPTRDSHSPEDWVARESNRLTGQGNTTGRRLDA